jgi:hypothetical protein
MLDNNSLSPEFTEMGERALQEAPVVTLANGNDCTPQHFFEFNHSLDSVETLISQIEFSEQYPIFVSCDNAGLFLQVGVMGYDNYQVSNLQQAKKIVYGRKWRVEKNLPSSEIIQTAFLAIKKAREHELREFVALYDAQSGKTSTPFNNHHDLPLMSNNHELFNQEDALGCDILNVNGLTRVLEKLKVGNRKIQLTGFIKRAQTILIDLCLGEPGKDRYHGEFSELNNVNLTLVIKHFSVNEVLHELMSELVKISDRFVDEYFLFDGFARFSRQQNIIAIGQFSIKTRNIEDQSFNEDRKEVFRQHNGMIDATRVPVIFNEAQRKRLEEVLV